MIHSTIMHVHQYSTGACKKGFKSVGAEKKIEYTATSCA